MGPWTVLRPDCDSRGSFFILQSESQQTQISRDHLAHIMRYFTHLNSFDMDT